MNPIRALLHVLLWIALVLVAALAWQAASVNLAVGVALGLIGTFGVVSLVATLAFVLVLFYKPDA